MFQNPFKVKRVLKHLFIMLLLDYTTAFRTFINCTSKSSSKSSRSILAPSLLATAGLGWVSINKPSAPDAMAALAMVPIICGLPPVTPLVWLGCCRLCVQSITTGMPRLLHNGNVPVIHHQVLVAKSGPPFRQHYFVVAGAFNFFHCKLHGIAAYKLSFFYIHNFTCFAGGNQQFGLPA